MPKTVIKRQAKTGKRFKQTLYHINGRYVSKETWLKHKGDKETDNKKKSSDA